MNGFDTTTGPAAAVFQTAAAGLPTTRDHNWQDRWATGQSPHGAWLIVADGITGGTGGAAAAQTAATVADSVLRGSDLMEGAVWTALEAAHTAVQPWFPNGDGGTTLTIVTLTPQRLVAGAVGDSPAYLLRDGALHRLSPPRSRGPLTRWIGQPTPASPWLDSWPITDPDCCVVACSDGVDAANIRFPQHTPVAEIVEKLLRRRTPNGDDATATAARMTRTPFTSETTLAMEQTHGSDNPLGRRR